MHTFLKRKGVYDVGMWLPNRDGVTSFCKFFIVPNLKEALCAVHLLNGGSMGYTKIDVVMEFLHITEVKDDE